MYLGCDCRYHNCLEEVAGEEGSNTTMPPRTLIATPEINR